MRIAIDGYFLKTDFTGVGRVLKNLLPEFDKTEDIEFFLITKDEYKEKSLYKNIKFIHTGFKRRYLLWQNYDFLKEVNKIKPDLIFSTAYTLPLFYKGKSLLLIHDVSWKKLKDDYSFSIRTLKSFQLQFSSKRATRIVTVSRFQKEEIEKELKVEEEKVSFIYNTVSPSLKRASDGEILDFKSRLGIETNVKLWGFLGSIFKRRNVLKLLKSFLELNLDDTHFIVVGKVYDGAKELQELFKNEAIHYIERIDEKDIPHFYSSLELFFYPSLYEGFGLPPAEALMCWTVPVLLQVEPFKELYDGVSIFIKDVNKEELLKAKNLIFKETFVDSVRKIWDDKKSKFLPKEAAKRYIELFWRLK